MPSNRTEIQNHEKFGDVHVSTAYERASYSSHSDCVIDSFASQKKCILNRLFFVPELFRQRGHPYGSSSFSNTRLIIGISEKHLRLAEPKLRRMLNRFQKLMDIRLWVLKPE